MNLTNLHKTLTDAGLKICGINSDGVISWVEPPTAVEIKAEQ